MIIAREKKLTNIAEYLIYMFQVEDTLRASNFDINFINNTIIKQFKVNDSEKNEIQQWYSGLIEMMKAEKLEQKGHLQFVKNTLNELNDFHKKILISGNDSKYTRLFQTALPNIHELRLKSDSQIENEIEICINGLYSLLLLRLQKKQITTATLNSMNTFSDFLAYLSVQFKNYESGKLEL